ncbi:uncharacterized protein LOC129616159 [Condylostylus longicornis]|uniref:uncharacterized protein LOC129616159 n=1 Tax=Condylostylus longicornis TaxID=2530218 RepID=UPI00244D9C5C|nr:uncharacterized protein LOC129616159 [Condylostylus longicornis]
MKITCQQFFENHHLSTITKSILYQLRKITLSSPSLQGILTHKNPSSKNNNNKCCNKRNVNNDGNKSNVKINILERRFTINKIFQIIIIKTIPFLLLLSNKSSSITQEQLMIISKKTAKNNRKSSICLQRSSGSSFTTIILKILSILKNFSFIKTLFMLLFILTISDRCDAGCRGEPPEDCESICTSNPYTDPNANCTLTALVLAPNSTFYEASLTKIHPILKIAEERVKSLKLLPPQIKFSWILRDDKCDAGYALIGAMDGIAKNCSHVIFGPACDYPLASVGRVAKYFHSEGTPILSVGGFTYDFQEKKTSCKDEFYMLIRTGIVSFQSISELIVSIMKNYSWNHTLLLYKRDGQRNVAGLHTCQLMMKTLVEVYKHLNVTYSPFDLDSGTKNLTEDLQSEIGTRHASLCPNTIDFVFSPNILNIFHPSVIT